MRYSVQLRRGTARASFVMDHGRAGPPGLFGGEPGQPNRIEIHQAGRVSVPEHLSKDQDIALAVGDRIVVHTPGGGGYGDPADRDPASVARDIRRGYYAGTRPLS